MSARTSMMPVMDVAVAADAGGHQLSSLMSRLADRWRKVRLGRVGGDALAELDAATLRDLGLDVDEVARAHAGEDFLPRAWA